LESWIAALKSPIVVGFEEDARQDTPVKEAPPLSLKSVVALELCLCHKDTPLGYRLLCGFFLLCVWASLRWSDAQRTPPDWIHLDGYTLPGQCRQTKTNFRGEVFAAVSAGLTKARC